MYRMLGGVSLPNTASHLVLHEDGCVKCIRDPIHAVSPCDGPHPGQPMVVGDNRRILPDEKWASLGHPVLG